MSGRWRVFRHEAGQEAGPHAAVYVSLYALCLLLGHWSASTFEAVIAWPANGVMLAALLQLPRRRAAMVLALCFGLNLASTAVRGDAPPFVWLNPLLNLVQVLVAGILTRRLCGAALDMRRPRRVVLFTLGAALPAVALTATIGVTVAWFVRDYSWVRAAFAWRHLFAMELLGLVIVTPSLLLLARAHRFNQVRQSPLEVVAILGLVMITALWIFNQSSPFLFLMFPPLMLAAFRLSPPWMAIALVLTMLISGLMTLTGHGPVSASPVPYVPELHHLSDRMRQMPLYYGFLLVAAMTALPISAMIAERRSFIARLARRTTTALEQRRRAEAADAVKSRFLALMSHEMRTPLNGVSGYADLLSRRDDLPPEAQTQVSAIRASGAAMLTLVEDVLDVSRGDEPLCLEPFDLEALICDAVALEAAAARAKGLEFVIDLALQPGGRVLGDARRLRGAVRHLTSNAVKFTDRGEVRIEASHVGDRLRIAVSDTGGGMDAAFIPHLFEPFAQSDDSLRRRHGGAGVGLPAAKRHAACMGGDVVLGSTSPAGSVFVLTAQLEALASLPSEVPGEAAPLRALIVDDHPVNRQMLRLMIEAAGCKAVEAVDGLEAVEKVEGDAFDLILMDVRMPRLDGLEATRRIRALPSTASETPILAVTADAMPEDAARCLAAGMDAHLAKPVTYERLYAAIDQTFRAAADREQVHAA
ncbi:response regulator [Brevundimonas sp. NPDC090276]|uniref:hybrid sensor histidine kinase/response regulator n=1 Tax=Brevundimonas sp. NPDC090276 TaxID=3363956 RepID=UPI00383A9B89